VDAGRPLSVDELLRLAQSKVVGLGIATVYRNLKALLQEGHVVQSTLPDSHRAGKQPLRATIIISLSYMRQLLEVHGLPR